MGPRKDDIVLVTGGTSTLGAAIIEEFLENGYTVCGSYLNDKEGARNLSEKRGVPMYKADLRSPTDVASLFNEIESDLGTVRVLVNNASTFITGPVTSMVPDEVRDAVEGVLYTTLFPILRAVPEMRASGGGVIINMGMAGAEKVRGYREVALHASAKTALAVLTRSLSMELEEDDIRVNMVNPGIVDRKGMGENWRIGMMEKYSVSRLVRPEEVAGSVLEMVELPEKNGEVLNII